MYPPCPQQKTTPPQWYFCRLWPLVRRIHPTYLLQFDDGETMEVDQPTKVPVRPERRVA